MHCKKLKYLLKYRVSLLTHLYKKLCCVLCSFEDVMEVGRLIYE